jgi:hypothetical protein
MAEFLSEIYLINFGKLIEEPTFGDGDRRKNWFDEIHGDTRVS